MTFEEFRTSREEQRQLGQQNPLAEMMTRGKAEKEQRMSDEAKARAAYFAQEEEEDLLEQDYTAYLMHRVSQCADDKARAEMWRDIEKEEYEAAQAIRAKYAKKVGAKSWNDATVEPMRNLTRAVLGDDRLQAATSGETPKENPEDARLRQAWSSFLGKLE